MSQNIAEFNVNPNTRQFLTDWAKASGLDFDPGQTFSGSPDKWRSTNQQMKALRAAETLDPGLYNQVVSQGDYGYGQVGTDYLSQFENAALNPAWEDTRRQHEWWQNRD